MFNMREIIRDNFGDEFVDFWDKCAVADYGEVSDESLRATLIAAMRSWMVT